MQNRSTWVAGCVVVLLSCLAIAQQAGSNNQVRNSNNSSNNSAPARNALGRGAPPLVADNSPYDKHDLSGVWLGNKYGFNATYEPPMTPEGKKKFDAQKPSYGATLGTPAASDAKVPSGRRRAIPPAQGNDYVGACNPLGLIRMLLYDPAPMEMIVTPKRIIQNFEWTWDHREIWLDAHGRGELRAAAASASAQT
jgi:hypothetical protein